MQYVVDLLAWDVGIGTLCYKLRKIDLACLAFKNVILWPRALTFQTALSVPILSTSYFPSAEIIALELCLWKELYLPA